jgi:hypothetical protein
MGELTRAVTDDFCEAWKRPDETFTGVTARIVAMGHLPLGVDAKDPRVVEIVRKCREANVS